MWALILALLVFVPYTVLLVQWIVVLWRNGRECGAGQFCRARSSRIALIVSCRNEGRHLPSLLKSIDCQIVAPDEIIIVDDHSTDNTLSLAADWTRSKSNAMVVKAVGEGKKAALIQAARLAQSEYLLFTDADCTLSEQFVGLLKGCLTETDADMVLGRVDIAPAGGRSFFGIFENIEFQSLQATTAAGALMDRPFMCNGANMAVRRQAYLDNSVHIRRDIASGDDMFILHAMKKARAKIVYLFDAGYSVTTCGVGSWRRFFVQRTRWAGKTSAYTDAYTIAVAATVAAANVAVLLLPIMSITVAMAAFILKMALDISIIALFMKAYHSSLKPLWLFPLVSAVYPFYVTIVGLVAILRQPKTKPRTSEQ